MSTPDLFATTAAGDPPATPRSRSSWGARLLGVAVLAVVAVSVTRMRVLDLHALSNAIRAIGVTPVLMGVAGGLGVVAFQALRWWVVTRPVIQIRWLEGYEALLAAALLNVFIPARGGDVLRVRHLARRKRVSAVTLFGAEVVDFSTDKAGWLLALLIMGLSGSPPPWMRAPLAAGCVVGAALFGAAVLLRRRIATGGAHRWSEDTGWKGRLARGLAASVSGPRALAAIGLAALPWAWEALVIHAVGAAAGLSLAPLQGFVLLTAFNLAMVVPSPGGLGVHEAATTTVLVSLGVPIERAAAFALAYHASQLAPYFTAGALSLLRWRRAEAP